MKKHHLSLLIILSFIFIGMSSCVTTLKGPKIGSFGYGGESVELAQSAEIPYFIEGENTYITLTVNGLTGVYLWNNEEEFTTLFTTNPLLTTAFDPKTSEAFVAKGAFSAAGFSTFDTQFYKASRFLVSVTSPESLNSIQPQRANSIGIIGKEVFSGFTVVKNPQTSLISITKGPTPVAPVKAQLDFQLLLPSTKGEMDAKISAIYFIPQYFVSLEGYTPPRMFVNLVGLSCKEIAPVTLPSGSILKNFQMTVGNAYKIKKPINGKVIFPIEKLAKGEDLYFLAAKTAIMDSKIKTGWVRFTSLEKEGDNLVIQTVVTAEKPF